VQAELVEIEGLRPRLVALQQLEWGAMLLEECSLLAVQADPTQYLKAEDADPKLMELAMELGEAERLAAYIAFKQLSKGKQREFLSFWKEGLVEQDVVARAIYEQNIQGTIEFVRERPEFSHLIDWKCFAVVASIFGLFGVTNPDGTRAVYRLCSHIRHSCAPNVAWSNMGSGFTQKKVVNVISLNGISNGDEITLSHAAEAVLIMGRQQRSLHMFKGTGLKCECLRCSEGSGFEDVHISHALQRLHRALQEQPPTDESVHESLDSLDDLNRLLPFSMQVKAKAKVLIAEALSLLAKRAAWEERSKEANIIQWTVLNSAGKEQRIRDMKRLYKTAAKEFGLLLGDRAVEIHEKLKTSYKSACDEHLMIEHVTQNLVRAERSKPQ